MSAVRCPLVYDITHDGTRGKVSEVCFDYGLERIQYSAFLGDLSRALQEELFRKVRKRLGKKERKIQLFPVCQKDIQQRLEVVNAPA
jgi:CRISPR-associated protein Cas2